MKLNSRILGEGKDLIILHGLYGSGDNWFTIARKFENYRVHLLDMRNHGDSPHDPDNSYKAMVADVMEYISVNNITSPIILGHSMGGKTAMWLSILHPMVAAKLIIVDISPADYAQVTNPSALINQHLNIINAMRSVDLATLKTRQEIDEELSIYISDVRIRQFLIKSIERKKNGAYHWKINVEAISNYLPEIMKGVEIEKHAPSVNSDMPVLFIKGELSNYIPEDDIEAIKTLYPKASIVTIFDSGHWIHAEKPDEFLAAVNHFLTSHE